MNHCPRCDFRSRRSRFVLLLLSLLICFGLGGIHRIYAGKVISGIIQLCTGGGFLIWQIIDILIIVFGGFTDDEGRVI
ncbi:MAG: TM2 domain-containing protein [Akkermansia sp.]|nr:TM2 domain-containing protein [Akkermansia sp.]